MSLPWIKLFSSLPRHPKALALDEVTGRRRAWTHMIDLWTWAAEYAPSGDLSDVSDRVIARAAGWSGNPSKFVTAIVTVGFLDDGRRLHAWDEHQAAHVERAERVASPADEADALERKRARDRERKARKSAERARKTAEGSAEVARNSAEGCGTVAEDSGAEAAFTPVSARAHAAESEKEIQRENQNSPPTPSPGVSASDSAPLLTPPPSKAVRQRKQRGSKSEIVVPTGDVAVVWQAYLKVSSASKLTADRADLIRRWLQPAGPYTAEQLVECIRGYDVSPYHNGVNETGVKHLGIELMLRNADKIENGWRYLAEHGASRPRRMPAEPSGRLPVYTPPVRPQEPVSEEDRRKAAEARQKLAKMTGGLADKVKPPDAPPPTRETLEARRAYLQEQARGLA